jgi:hypothetical protein
MEYNPYQSPPPYEYQPAIGVKSGSREDLKAVAQYQKGILVCILIYLVAVIGQFAIPPNLRILVALSIVAVGIAGTVFVFLLAMKVYSTGLGIFLGLLTVLPCVGLIVLLAVNGKATRILRENGIRVGLLGADLSKI